MLINYLFNLLILSGDGWQEKFYRTVDTLASPKGNKLRKMEEKVFRSQKGVVVKESRKKEWRGTSDQNSLADMKVSHVIRKLIEEFD